MRPKNAYVKVRLTLVMCLKGACGTDTNLRPDQMGHDMGKGTSVVNNKLQYFFTFYGIQ